jgi:hypothetical protein
LVNGKFCVPSQHLSTYKNFASFIETALTEFLSIECFEKSPLSYHASCCQMSYELAVFFFITDNFKAADQYFKMATKLINQFALHENDTWLNIDSTIMQELSQISVNMLVGDHKSSENFVEYLIHFPKTCNLQLMESFVEDCLEQKFSIHVKSALIDQMLTVGNSKLALWVWMCNEMQVITIQVMKNELECIRINEQLVSLINTERIHELLTIPGLLLQSGKFPIDLDQSTWSDRVNEFLFSLKSKVKESIWAIINKCEFYSKYAAKEYLHDVSVEFDVWDTLDREVRQKKCKYERKVLLQEIILTQICHEEIKYTTEVNDLLVEVGLYNIVSCSSLLLTIRAKQRALLKGCVF